MDDDVEMYRVWRIRKTVLNLCHDRGYLVPMEDMNQTLDEFKAFHKTGPPKRSDLIIKCTHNTDLNDRLLVFFADDPKIGVKTVQSYLMMMEEQGIRRGIVVVRLGLTPSAKSAMKNISADYYLEDFLESEMLTNITEHELVPRHILLTDEEKLDLFAKYRLKENQLMKLPASDPIARYYGYKRGQVIKIIRNSETAGRYVTHRVVI